MKLDEVISTNQKVISPQSGSSVKDRLRVKSGNNNLEFIGKGRLGSVYKHKKRPGTVLKVGRLPFGVDEDGYLAYLMAIFKNNRMASNPYFPRVYDLRIIDHSKSRSMSDDEYVAEIEELYSFDDLSPDELNAIGDKIFHDWQGIKDRNYIVDRSSDLSSNLAVTIQSMLANRSDDEFLSQVRDKHFIQAIAIISNISKKAGGKTGIYPDIVTQNLMVRRTPVGPQLVLSDPLG